MFADLVMPGMSGVEFHAALGRLDPDLAARTVFVTGGTFTRSAAEFVERMGDRVLEKPVGAEQVRAAVATALRAGLRRRRSAVPA